MQLALLSGASPRHCVSGPAVRLHKGSWRLNIQGIVDSKLNLNVEGYECSNAAYEGMMIQCEETEVVCLSFAVRGNEPYITAIAEKVA